MPLQNAFHRRRPALRGFSLIELLIALAIVGILGYVAYPSYVAQLVRSSRASAQAELMTMAGIQEKIYLNTNTYTCSVGCAYNGTASALASCTNSQCAYNGLGYSTTSKDKNYTFSITVSAAHTGQPDPSVYTITATPVPGSTQANDGPLSIDQSGHRTGGPTGTW